jgi:hypothetical protein
MGRNIISLLPVIRRKLVAQGVRVSLSMCLRFQLLKQLSDFLETWDKLYAIGGHPSDVVFNFVHSVIITWQTRLQKFRVCLTDLIYT